MPIPIKRDDLQGLIKRISDNQTWQVGLTDEQVDEGLQFANKFLIHSEPSDVIADALIESLTVLRVKINV